MPMSRLALGTVQFGLPYGISNVSGQVSEPEVFAILALAGSAGIDMLDTAASYANAEETVGRLADRLGRPFRIVSKTIPGAEADLAVERALQSAEMAGPGGLDTLLVHHPADLAGSRGERLWTRLRCLVDGGATRRLGISASFDDRPLDLARRFSPDVMQVPVSLFDQRLIRDGTIDELRTHGIEVHARSVFLQGLLFDGEFRLPEELRHQAERIVMARQRLKRSGVSLARAALGFVMSQPSISRAVVGVTSRRELNEVLACASQPDMGLDWQSFAIEDSRLLNPSRWTS